MLADQKTAYDFSNWKVAEEEVPSAEEIVEIFRNEVLVKPEEEQSGGFVWNFHLTQQEIIEMCQGSHYVEAIPEPVMPFHRLVEEHTPSIRNIEFIRAWKPRPNHNLTEEQVSKISEAYFRAHALCSPSRDTLTG